MSTSPPAAKDDADTPSVRFFNREVSWLEFNARVLAQAEDPSLPLLERVKFCAIYAQNLDEFFQVRVAGLKEQVASGVSTRTADGLTAGEQLAQVGGVLEGQLERLSGVFRGALVPALGEAGIEVVSWADLTEAELKLLGEYFHDEIYPVLTPLAVDPGHPFPYISDLSLNLAVTVRDHGTGEHRFARVKVPPLLPRLVRLPGGGRFVPLEQVISAHLDALFAGMDVLSRDCFRVTRNADIELEEKGADDLLEAVDLGVRRRRFGEAVRLELASSAPEEVVRLLQRELDLHADDVYRTDGLLAMSDLWQLVGLDHPELKWPTWHPVTQFRLGAGDDERVDLFAELRHADILVHHPYESFTTSVEEFVRQAAADPDVLAIKIAMYRTAEDSSIVRSLIRAADRGKQVAALIELKARFDEEANIEWARRLERAGVHVVYGLVGLKTHAKVALVVRREADGVRRYCHFGTGNYNSSTARIYGDLGLFTADAELGADLGQMFNYLTGYGRDISYRRLLVAPSSLRDQLVRYIDNEIAAGPGKGRIVMKMNSLSDAGIIEDLYRASQAGVQIELIVRGICCLVPGVAGLSENIRVRSIVGRYLEHARILHFANGDGSGVPAYYIGSADLMGRNLNRRVEAMAPVLSPDLRERIDEILQINLQDDVLAWELRSDGSYVRVSGTTGTDTHRRLEELEQRRGRARLR
jgi:polyphosphate kinase